MNENKTILTVILVSILVIYVLFFTYILVRYVARKDNQIASPLDKPVVDINKIQITSSPYHTDFYNKSIEHAEKVLFSKAFDPQYGEANYYGNILMDVIGKLNNETKNSVVIAIKHFSIESVKARANEQLFRTMSQQEGVPLWFIILRSATKMVLPDFSIDSNQSDIGGKIVPLYQKTG